MDRDLLGSSLRYHGSYLLKQMAVEDQLTEEDVDTLRNSYQIPQVDEPRDEFDCKLVKFIAKKADLLFSKENNDDARKCIHKSSRLGYCAVLPPLEFFMEVSKTARKQQLYRNLNRGDVVVGVITAQHDIGLTVSLLALDGGVARDIADLKLVAFCPLREIPKVHVHEDSLEAFSLKDKIRAVVVGVTDDKITISMQKRALPSHLSCALGTIADEDIPAYCRAVESVDSRSYNTMLREAPEFNNPSDVCNMSEAFGLNEVEFQPSLMRRHYRVKYNEADYADKLRKEQSRRLAMRSVAEGVDHFKHGRTVEAMQMFNKALQVDSENVEALVARGALYANSEGYERALEDFDTALAINPNHVNAQKYACDTLLALGRSLLEVGDTNSAISKVYRASLLRPNNPETAELLADIKRRMLESDGIVSSDTAAVEEDNSAVVHHHDESLSKSKGKAVHDRRRSSASGNRSDATRKRRRTVSSSSDADCVISSSSKPTKHRRKRRSRAERRPSSKSLEWIQRDATDVHPQSPLTELVGCTKSDQQKAYDVNFMNPERRHSIDNEEATVSLTSSYGPALPPASPPARRASKKSTTDRAGRAARKKTSKRSRKRSVSSSSSSSDSSGSSRTDLSSSSSSNSTSNSSGHRKRSEIQQGKDKRKERKRNSLETTSKKSERAPLLAGKQSKANRSVSREADEKSVSSRSRSSSRSRNPLQSSRKQKIKHERSHSAERDRAKLRRKSDVRRSSKGNATDDSAISSRRASAGEYRHGHADSSKVVEHSVVNRSSVDSRRSSGDRRRKPERKQAQIEVRKQSTSKRSGRHSSSSSPSSQSDVKVLPCKPVVTVKTDARLTKNGVAGSIGDGSKISTSADDNKTKKSAESLRDMEDFLKQLKANSQMKGFKK